MLQQPAPDDFVVSTGQTHSVREFCDAAFSHLGLDYQKYVAIDPKFFRPAEKIPLVGDPTRAKERLGWQPGTDFTDLVKMMVDKDLQDLAPKST